jgi:hypothetical protein
MNEQQTQRWNELREELRRKGWKNKYHLDLARFCFMMGWQRDESDEKIEWDYREWR